MNYPDVSASQFESIESAIISATVGRQCGIPVRLDPIIREIGARVTYTCSASAFTHFQTKGPVIHVSTAARNSKGRFIVAHELAHIMLRSPTAIQLIEDRGQHELLDNEEEFANLVAGALLVPDHWLEQVKSVRLTPAVLTNMAQRADLPISMLVRRMVRFGIDVALLHWRRGRRSSWHVIDRPGIPSHLRGNVEVSALGRRVLDHLGYSESDIVIDCRVNGNWTRIKGNGRRFGDHGECVLQILAPRNDIIYPSMMMRGRSH
jgi:hypothetical protein